MDEATRQQLTLDWSRLLKSQHSKLFRAPVDWRGLGLADYPQIIEEPMDLGTVGKRLAEGYYASAPAFWRDVHLIWQNCRQYNVEASFVYQQSLALEEYSWRLEDTPGVAVQEPRLPPLDAPSSVDLSTGQRCTPYGRVVPVDLHIEVPLMAGGRDRTTRSKQKGGSKITSDAVDGSAAREDSESQFLKRCVLCHRLSQLAPNNLHKIVSYVRNSASNAWLIGSEGTAVIDVDVLKDRELLALNALVKFCLRSQMGYSGKEALKRASGSANAISQ